MARAEAAEQSDGAELHDQRQRRLLKGARQLA
jgi:hypothetical protein